MIMLCQPLDNTVVRSSAEGWDEGKHSRSDLESAVRMSVHGDMTLPLVEADIYPPLPGESTVHSAKC